MGFYKPALALAAATVAAVGLATPAYAVSPITVTSPNGDLLASGAEVIISGNNASAFTETISVECDNSARYPSADVDPGSFSVSVGSFSGPDTCRIYDGNTWDQLATFDVAAPATAVADPAVDKQSFYPMVRDGYRDTVTFRWWQERQARASISVVNADGRIVRTATPRAYRGRNNWSWNGRRDNGDLVAEGRYRIRVTVNSNMVSAGVDVATGYDTKSFSLRREGNRSSSVNTIGDCHIRRDSYYDDLTLDCWGGRLAKATYRFAIPARAFDVRGTVNLDKTVLDFCCRGKISKGWSRTSKRTVALWASVTGWRATDVDFVRVSYKTKVRI